MRMIRKHGPRDSCRPPAGSESNQPPVPASEAFQVLTVTALSESVQSLSAISSARWHGGDSASDAFVSSGVGRGADATSHRDHVAVATETRQQCSIASFHRVPVRQWRDGLQPLGGLARLPLGLLLC